MATTNLSCFLKQKLLKKKTSKYKRKIKQISNVDLIALKKSAWINKPNNHQNVKPKPSKTKIL